MITRREKPVTVGAAKKAEVSDFVSANTTKKTASRGAINKAVPRVAAPGKKKMMDFGRKPVTKKVAMKEVSMKKVDTKEVAIKKVAPKKIKRTDRGRAPMVSVVIVARNAAKCIDSAIHSVLGQTYQDFELIIVDDCSEDQTLKVISGFSSDKITVISLSEKSGMAKARNAGIKKASGRFVCFLNARDMWQPEKLKRQIEFMRDNGSAFSFASYVFADENGRPSGRPVRVPTEISRLQSSRLSAVWASTVMFDLSKLNKEDILMTAAKNSKIATWKRVLKKIGSAHGLNEVLAIRGYDTNVPLWKKAWRRV